MIYRCPKCESLNIKKNGHSKNNKQQYRCNDCGRGFVENPQSREISNDTKEKIKLALLERNSLRGICRIFSVSLTWLLGFAEKLYQETSDNIGFELRTDVDIDLQILETEADEMWSFVGKKENKVWIWILMDRNTRQVIAFHVGGRKKKDAKKLWKKIPKVLKKGIIVYTDFYAAYRNIIPKKKHVASGKDAGNTNHIERLNGTIRQRVSRLVRLSLSFSKKMENHIGAIGYFLYHYNKELKLRSA